MIDEWTIVHRPHYSYPFFRKPPPGEGTTELDPFGSELVPHGMALSVAEINLYSDQVWLTHPHTEVTAHIVLFWTS